MPTFSFNARDIHGQAITGTLTGSDERIVREQLRSKNLYVTQLKTEGVAHTPSGARTGVFTGRVKLYDLVIFSRQFATLVRAGLTITEALDALAQQTRNPTLRSVVLEMQQDIRGGGSLAEAMKQHPRVFSELYVSLVEAGELGGLLEKTLETAATALDTEMEIREKIKSAFVYPIAVIVTAVSVVSFLLAYVVPVFANVYKQFKAELPAITKLLIVISDVLRSYWWVGALAAFLLTVFTARAYRTYRGRRVIDASKIKLPLFGGLIEKIGLARMSHTLSALTDAGVPLIRALGTAGRVSGSSLVMDALGEVTVKIQQGVSVGVAMADTGRFPILVTRMIGVGEESGNLAEMLEQVAMFFDREVDYGTKRLMTLMEPVLTVFLGLVVGFILLALYVPIFNLAKVIR